MPIPSATIYHEGKYPRIGITLPPMASVSRGELRAYAAWFVELADAATRGETAPPFDPADSIGR